jgi:hypothetical protein
VDYELKSGYADYSKVRDQIQFNIKHWEINIYLF